MGVDKEVSLRAKELIDKWGSSEASSILTKNEIVGEIICDLSELEEKIDSLEYYINDMEEADEKWRTERIELYKEIKQLKEENDMFRQTIDDLNCENQDLFNDNEKLETKISDLEGEIEDWYELYHLINRKFIR